MIQLLIEYGVYYEAGNFGIKITDVGRIKRADLPETARQLCNMQTGVEGEEAVLEIRLKADRVKREINY